MEQSKRHKIHEIIQEMGRIPPQSIDMEEAVLGAILIDSDGLWKVSGSLRAEMFYKEHHNIIYSALLKLKDGVVDTLTLVNQLRSDQNLDVVGGPLYISRLTNTVASAAHIEHHAEVIIEKYKLREAIRIGQEIQEHAFADDHDKIGTLTSELSQAISTDSMSKLTKNCDVGPSVMETIEKIHSGEIDMIGLSSGYRIIDRMLNGLKPPDLITIAARPSMGKTALALGLAIRVAQTGNKVKMFSMEMNSTQLFLRQLSHETGIPYNKFERRDGLEDKDMEMVRNTGKELEALPLDIDDSTGLIAREIRARIRKSVIVDGTKLVIFDYLQLAYGEKGQSPEEVVSSISRALKHAAMENNIPIIALSQLNRDVEKTASKRPNLSHLRSSGAIEQDSDIVMFIYRPEYYGMTEDENGESTEGKAILIVAKNRNGPTGDIVMGFTKRHMYFDDLDDVTVTDDVTQVTMFNEPDDKEVPY